MPSQPDPAKQDRKVVADRSVLQQNREFFDQFFTQVVKTRFQQAADESAARRMTVAVLSCNAARCQLSVEEHILLLSAAQMNSTNPEIHITLASPREKKRPLSLPEILQWMPPDGWINRESRALVTNKLSDWLDQTVNDFLLWVISP